MHLDRIAVDHACGAHDPPSCRRGPRSKVEVASGKSHPRQQAERGDDQERGADVDPGQRLRLGHLIWHHALPTDNRGRQPLIELRWPAERYRTVSELRAVREPHRQSVMVKKLHGHCFGTRFTRDDDERPLGALTLRDAGVPLVEIGEQFGLSRAATRSLFRRVQRDTEAAEADAQDGCRGSS